MISRRLAFGMLASAAAIGRVSAHPHSTFTNEQHGDIERQIMTFRSLLKDVVAAKDVNRLKAMFADSFTHTHGSGKVDGKDARIVSLLVGEPTIEMASASELSFRVHGQDMVILTGRSPILNVKENRDYDFRWVQVYTRASGDWQLAVSQATRLPTTS